MQQGAFHRFMDAQFSSLPTWLDVVPFAAELARDSKPEDVIFVDVYVFPSNRSISLKEINIAQCPAHTDDDGLNSGGGNGSQLAALKKTFPEIKGRMILQDRPHVLKKALEVDGMEVMAHDFLTRQPVKGKPKRTSLEITSL